jgi:murein DD-endopeptidase MepM/ murein hydrolase activator NlpD
MARGLHLSTARGAFGLGVVVGTFLGLVSCGLGVWHARPPALGSSATSDEAFLRGLSRREIRGGTGPLLFPVSDRERSRVADGFGADRGGRRHEALDILSPRGTPVVAASDGRVERLSTSPGGGRGVYQRSESGPWCYYYAHLDRYAPGLKAGQVLVRGQVLGLVGSSGNAPRSAPHLHFAVYRVRSGQACSQGTPVDPRPLLGKAGLAGPP